MTADPGTEFAPMVDRDRELALLLELFEAASVGRRQVVLITGTPGIGKSALVAELVRVLASSASPPRIGRGQCYRRNAASDPYAPVLAAISQITADRRSDDACWTESPTWLVQMRSLLSPHQHEHLQHALLGTGSSRMLREGVELVERLSQQQPLVLVLEDIHRADRATLEWLAEVVPRQGSARLMVIATLRASTRAHTAAQAAASALLDHADRVTRIELAPLQRSAAREYAALRLPNLEPAQQAALADASQGHPLFLEMLADDVAAGAAAPAQPAASLRELLTRWIDELEGEELAVLEAASVAGTTFTAREVAAALGRAVADIDGVLSRHAARRRLLQIPAAAGNAAATRGYEFRHLVFAKAMLERTPAARRREFHATLGTFLEQQHGGDLRPVVPRLLWHFEGAGDVTRLASCLEQAAAIALSRFAHRETCDLTERAIAAIHRLPGTRESALREAARLLDLGNLTVSLWGFGDARAYRAYDRALEQARRHGDELLVFRAHLGRCLSSVVTGDCAARDSAGSLLEIVSRGHVQLASVAHLYNSYVDFVDGCFADASEHAVAAERTLAQALPGVPVFTDLEAFVHVALALALTPMGQRADAQAHRQRALVRLESHGYSYQRVNDLSVLAAAALAAGDAASVLELSEKSIAVMEAFGVPKPPMLAACCRAWARCRKGEGSLEALESAVEERARSREMWFETLLFVALAEEFCAREDLERAGYWLRRAGRMQGEAAFEAELWRVRGLLAGALEARGQKFFADDVRMDFDPGPRSAMTAQDCFAASLRIARSQGAHLFEERTALAMAGQPRR
ncbi:MAG TPA: AAA family ATPase [Candidatus Binatia bacterium]|nr:AAA family ATPase [Candidatus Binatia bacterium]